MSRLCLRWYVSGLVQGVGFRASVSREAQRLGLDGYARNLLDGRVEVVASGLDDDLARLHAWLQRGPDRAHVDQVDCQSAAESTQGGFYIR